MNNEDNNNVEDMLVELINQSANLYLKGDEITNQIISEEDPSKLDELTQLFNMNQKKKEIARVNKLSNLLDSIDTKVGQRINNYGDLIDDKDLINYWKITQEAIAGRTDEDNQVPKITINNTQNINVNSSGLNRESRAKVLDAVNQILGNLNTEDNVIDIVPEKKEDR